MKKFENFTEEDLWQLRQEVNLFSACANSFRNTFGISPFSIFSFFEGYLDYLCELIQNEKGKNFSITIGDILEKDTPTNLKCWHECSDDFSWVEYNESNF